MSDTTGHFDAHWLRLRESIDHRARDPGLTEQARDWLLARQTPAHALSLVDLGSGGASNVAYLAPRLPGPQRWRLVDHDATLLGQAATRLHRLADGADRPLEWISDHRGLQPLDAALLDGCDLVVASALFDLVSRDWLDALVEACAQRRVAGLFTLSVTGDWAFVDARGHHHEDDDDRWLRGVLAAHQRRDKGFGPALGGDAPTWLADRFAARGYQIARAPSPWQLPAGAADATPLATTLIDGWAQAAGEQAPDDTRRIATWLERRRQALASGRLGLCVEHDDLFVVPGDAA
ncbi:MULTISPECIES: hypothetical protein [unclassified Modicisalibacter]|uniref:hypothetical protein n=1 Tax=unclassified Modicisalibacter TaxID=2679913 RepID=UPI001CCD75DA|nr:MULTISPECIES: hypothetical protein [unclassified Modicisalibacter]MBZ9560272.1 hypothetical protein [Modicisalibacter sp. R2A 31.J]MBZ9576181.1 hypothetical protein [Modicisalibacter sp. MOD 31.J]